MQDNVVKKLADYEHYEPAVLDAMSEQERLQLVQAVRDTVRASAIETIGMFHHNAHTAAVKPKAGAVELVIQRHYADTAEIAAAADILVEMVENAINRNADSNIGILQLLGAFNKKAVSDPLWLVDFQVRRFGGRFYNHYSRPAPRKGHAPFSHPVHSP